MLQAHVCKLRKSLIYQGYQQSSSHFPDTQSHTYHPFRHALWRLAVQRDHYIWRPPNTTLLWLCLLQNSFLCWARVLCFDSPSLAPFCPPELPWMFVSTWQLLLYWKIIPMYILPTIDPILWTQHVISIHTFLAYHGFQLPSPTLMIYCLPAIFCKWPAKKYTKYNFWLNLDWSELQCPFIWYSPLLIQLSVH